jgi:hypothetical protein
MTNNNNKGMKVKVKIFVSNNLAGLETDVNDYLDQYVGEFISSQFGIATSSQLQYIMTIFYKD